MFSTETGQYRYIRPIFTTSWYDARNYCKKYYSDLAIARSKTENDQLKAALQGYGAWIGLHRDLWKWSDESLFTASLNWATGQPNMTGLKQSCGVINPDGLIDDQPCLTTFPFICFTCKFYVLFFSYSSYIMDIIYTYISRQLPSLNKGLLK